MTPFVEAIGLPYHTALDLIIKEEMIPQPH